MDESTKTEYIETEIVKIKLDYKALDKWRKPDSDDLPVCSFLSLYEACGLEPYIRKYSEENDNVQIAAADNLLCNFYTMQRLKNYIENMWQVYSLDIDKDGHVFWDPTSRYPKGKKHYAKKLKSKIKACVLMDFANFCPGLDDEMEDDTIAFRIYEKKIIDAIA